MDLLVVLLAGAFTGWLTGGVIKRGGLGNCRRWYWGGGLRCCLRPHTFHFLKPELF